METPRSVCAAVLAVVQAALVAAGRPAQSALVTVGAVAVDNCCDGVLVVAPERVFRTTGAFPTEASADGQCQDTLVAVELLVRVDRCVPVLDSQGRPPSVQDQEDAAASVLLDAAIVWNAVTSAALLGDDGTGYPAWERANVAQTFVGPTGGCIGVETRLTIGVEQDAWCLV